MTDRQVGMLALAAIAIVCVFGWIAVLIFTDDSVTQGTNLVVGIAVVIAVLAGFRLSFRPNHSGSASAPDPSSAQTTDVYRPPVPGPPDAG